MGHPGSSMQEIPLSEILEVRPAGNFTLVPSGTNAHCFEIITGTMCYFVGEDSNTPAPLSPQHALPQPPPSPSQVAPNSGIGREVAKAWESAIRQALMPVIFQDAPPAEGNATHSESRLHCGTFVKKRFGCCWFWQIHEFTLGTCIYSNTGSPKSHSTVQFFCSISIQVSFLHVAFDSASFAVFISLAMSFCPLLLAVQRQFEKLYGRHTAPTQ